MPAEALPRPHETGAPAAAPAAPSAPAALAVAFPPEPQEPADPPTALVALPQPLSSTPPELPVASVAVAAPRATTGHAIPYHRIYRDALGRPMTGQVTFTGTQRTTTGAVVVPVAPVTVTLDEHGALNVHLPRDTYLVSASLRTVDGERVIDTDTVPL